VAQSILNYVMSCFQLPDGIWEKMRAIISNHWWGFDGGKKKMHWRSWDWLTTPKFMGGMGLDFQSGNVGKTRLAVDNRT